MATMSPSTNAVAAAEYIKFYELAPTEETPTAKTWYARGQNFLLAYSEAAPGANFERADQADEYVLLLPDAASRIQIDTPDERVQVAGHQLVVVPPGRSTVRVIVGGRVVRVFSNRSEDLLTACVNAESYAVPHAYVAPFAAWPSPANGYRVRAYDLNVPEEQGRFGRIWRCSTMMVNWGESRTGPRDPTRLSPHAHTDFEQCSLILEGDYVHHLRWPWTTNIHDWRADDHEPCGSPSMTVIPPTTIHTSQAVGLGANQLIDIFCPPRLDFSKKPGWVLNADEYPMKDDDQ